MREGSLQRVHFKGKSRNVEEMSESNSMDVEHGQSDDEEYEDLLVYVEFPDFDQVNLLNEGTAVVELHDLATANPTCKINDLNFVGNQEINLGTQLFFQHTPDSVEFEGTSVNVVKFQLSSIGDS